MKQRRPTPTRRALLLSAAGLAAAGLATAEPAWAAKNPQVELLIDTQQLRVGQTVTAQLRLVDGVTRGAPELVAGDGLQVRFAGQSTQHVVVNFEATRITSFSYSVTAVAPGEWQVGPASLTVGSRTLTAPAVQVTVEPRDAAEAKTHDVVATVSDPEPFLGEVVVYRFRHQHAERVLDLDWTPPGFDGFVSEKIAEPSQREYTVREGGTAMGVEEISIPLVATALGDRVVPPAVVSAKVPSRDQSQRRRSPFMSSVDTLTLATDPISVRIRPLPEDGRPADFSGLVGRFRLQSRVQREGGGAVDADQRIQVPLGESLTMEITLSGSGTLAGVSLPPPADEAGYRAYDDSPEIQARVSDGQLSSVATFRRAVVPEAQGELTVAPVTLTVFDPDREQYVTLTTKPLRLDVVEGDEAGAEVRRFGEAEEGAVDTRAEVQSLGEDILPVAGDATVKDRSLRAALPLALGLPALPALGLFGLVLTSLRGRRTPDPRQELRQRLQQLPADPRQRVAALEGLFRDAAALRLGQPAPGLTWEAVAGIGPDAAALYDALERARYSGDPSQVQDLLVRVGAFVEAT